MVSAEQTVIRRVCRAVAKRINSANDRPMVMSNFVVLCDLPKHSSLADAKRFGFSHEHALRHAMTALIRHGWVKRELTKELNPARPRYAYSYTPAGLALFNPPKTK